MEWISKDKFRITGNQNRFVQNLLRRPLSGASYYWPASNRSLARFMPRKQREGWPKHEPGRKRAPLPRVQEVLQICESQNHHQYTRDSDSRIDPIEESVKELKSIERPGIRIEMNRWKRNRKCIDSSPLSALLCASVNFLASVSASVSFTKNITSTHPWFWLF